MPPPSDGLDPTQEQALAFLSFAENARPSVPDLGTDLGEYVLERKLGFGASGVVFEARQKSLGRLVALKLMPFRSTDLNSDGQRRLQREAQLLASLRHYHIVEVYDTGSIPGFRWIAMELIDGWSLSDVLAAEVDAFPQPGGKDWLAFIVPILQQVADALSAAHQREIIHRDIKPGNILLDKSGRVVLVDFGLARLHEDHNITRTQGFVGTPRYTSPEQARGAAVTAASDVFSFGAVAFESLNGAPPFAGKTTSEVLHQVQFNDPKWTNQLAVPADLRAVVEKCLEKDRRRGYADAGEVAADLDRFLRYEPVLAVSSGRLTKIWRRTLRQPKKALLALSLIALASFAIAASFQAAQTSEDMQLLQTHQDLVELESILHRGSTQDFLQRANDLLLNNNSAGASALLGDYFLILEKPETALVHYTRAKGRLKTFSFADRLGYLVASERVKQGFLPTLPDLSELPEIGRPQSARDFALLAAYHIQRGNFQDATKAAEAGLGDEPVSFPLHLVNGTALRGLRQTERALVELYAALRLRPNDPVCLRRLAKTLNDTSHTRESVNFCQQALEVTPLDPELWADLAGYFLTLEQHAEAQEALNKALSLDPAGIFPSVISIHANFLIDSDQLEAAEALLRQKLVQFPRSPYLISRLAWLSWRQGNLDEAMRLATWMIEQPIPGWKVSGYVIRSRCLDRLGRMEEAIASLNQALEMHPDLRTWDWSSIGGLLKLGKIDAVAEFLGTALERDPDVVRARLLYADVWCRRNDFEKALENATHAYGLDPGNASSSYWMARAWLGLENYAAAKLCCLRALHLHPASKRVNQLLAEIELHLK
jgi:serine/threonine protein kinase/Flp pilus assembly protein TadD